MAVFIFNRFDGLVCKAAQRTCSQRGSAGRGGHASVVESILTQALSQAAAALHLIGSFTRKGGLQLRPL